jgi:hypothetical protein
MNLFKLIILFAAVNFSAMLKAQNLAPNPGFQNLDPAVPNPKGYCWNAGSAGSGINSAGIPYVSADSHACQPTGWGIWLNGATAEDKANLCVITEALPFGSNCIPWPVTNENITPNIKLDKMLHIKTTKSEGGIVAVLTLPKKSAKQVYSCWVYVVKGEASLHTLSTVALPVVGTATQNTVSTQTCKWEKLTITRTDGNGNELTVYSAENDADFYVCNVSANIY